MNGNTPGSTHRRRRTHLPVAGCGLILAALSLGCDSVPYVLHVAQSQLGIQGSTEPIPNVLASGRLSEDDQDKLALAVRAREYAVGVIGLNGGGSYTSFYDTNGDPLAWNLSAAPQHALTPKTWWFPVVGELPYLAFFDEDYLRRYERELIDAGFDTFTYELDAYSTLGLFDDPVRSPMLRRGTLSLVETIIHELLHNTVYRTNDTNYNESLASFVGRQGAIEFLMAEYGADSGWAELARAFYADTDRVNAFLSTFYDELHAYYGSQGSRQEKIAGRAAVFEAARQRFTTTILPQLTYPEVFVTYSEMPTNNAWVLANRRYNLDLTLFAAVYDAVGRNWGAALAVYQAAAGAPEDPFDHLRAWLQQAPAPAE